MCPHIFITVEIKKFWELNSKHGLSAEKAAPLYLDSATPQRTMGAFSSFKVPKILQDFSSHRIFRRMHEVLNIGKKITNCTVCL
jgi:hypothetical protein